MSLSWGDPVLNAETEDAADLIQRHGELVLLNDSPARRSQDLLLAPLHRKDKGKSN
jgi:hypothetical protein